MKQIISKEVDRIVYKENPYISYENRQVVGLIKMILEVFRKYF